MAASNGSNLKTGGGGGVKGKRPRSRTPVPVTPPVKATPPNVLKDGERPSTSKLSCAGSGAEESSSGKPPEKCKFQKFRLRDSDKKYSKYFLYSTKTRSSQKETRGSGKNLRSQSSNDV